MVRKLRRQFRHMVMVPCAKRLSRVGRADAKISHIFEKVGNLILLVGFILFVEIILNYL